VDRGWRSNVRLGGSRADGAPPTRHRTAGDACATAARIPVPPDGGRAAAVAAREPDAGSRHASVCGARVPFRRSPRARPESNRGIAPVGACAPRAPVACDAPGGGPGSALHAHALGGDSRRARDRPLIAPGGLPGQLGSRTGVRRKGIALSTWSPLMGGPTRRNAGRATSERMSRFASPRGAWGSTGRSDDASGAVGAAAIRGYPSTADRLTGRCPPQRTLPPVALGRPAHLTKTSQHAPAWCAHWVTWRASGCSWRRA
jgi:hypothetical protein